MLNFKISVFYLYCHNKPYRAQQHFQSWPKTWGDYRYVILPSQHMSGYIIPILPGFAYCHVAISIVYF